MTAVGVPAESGMEICGMYRAWAFSSDHEIGQRSWPVPRRTRRGDPGYSRFFRFHAPRGPGVYEFRLFAAPSPDGDSGTPFSAMELLGRGAMVRVEAQGNAVVRYLGSMASNFEEMLEQTRSGLSDAERAVALAERAAAAAAARGPDAVAEAVNASTDVIDALKSAEASVGPRNVHRACRGAESVAFVLARLRVGPNPALAERLPLVDRPFHDWIDQH